MSLWALLVVCFFIEKKKAWLKKKLCRHIKLISKLYSHKGKNTHAQSSLEGEIEFAQK